MAITVTAANVRPLEGAIVRNYQAGAAVTVGNCVYLDSSGYVQHADANTATEAPARGWGVVVASKDGETSVSSGDRCSVVIFGRVGGFAGMTPGDEVFVSTTAGGYTHTAPTGGAYQHELGRAESASVLFVNPAVEPPSSV